MARDSRTQDTRRRPGGGRRYARVAVPVGIAGVAALAVGLVPALASAGGPSLPHLTARQLLAKMADSRTETLSGTVKTDVDLGLPDIGGASGAMFGGGGPGQAQAAPGTSHGAHKAAPSSSAASPQSHLADLASGSHTFQVAVDGPKRQSFGLVEKLAEYRVVHNGANLWAYDSKANSVWHRSLKADGMNPHGKSSPPRSAQKDAPTPGAVADKVLKLAGPSTDVAVDGTSTVAGRDAYDLVLTPKSSGSTVGSVRIAVDAKKYVPLKLTVNTRSGGAPAIDVGYSSVSFAKPAASRFAFRAPKGATVTEAKPGAKAKAGHARGGPEAGRSGTQVTPNRAAAEHDVKTFGKGWATVYRAELGGGGHGKASTRQFSGLLGALGSHTSGAFGSGTVVKSRLLNALVTDDGRVYVGAVSTGDLVKAANADH